MGPHITHGYRFELVWVIALCLDHHQTSSGNRYISIRLGLHRSQLISRISGLLLYLVLVHVGLLSHGLLGIRGHLSTRAARSNRATSSPS